MRAANRAGVNTPSTIIGRILVKPLANKNGDRWGPATKWPLKTRKLTGQLPPDAN
jgi:hypothetical protein